MEAFNLTVRVSLVAERTRKLLIDIAIAEVRLVAVVEPPPLG